MKFIFPRKWETERKEEERGKKIQGYTSRWMKNEIKYSIWSSPCQESEKQQEKKKKEGKKYKDTHQDEWKIKLNILFEVHLAKKVRNSKKRRRKRGKNTRIHIKMNEKWN